MPEPVINCVWVFIFVRPQTIKHQSAALKQKYGLTTMAGEVKENAKKNRYKDILPCE